MPASCAGPGIYSPCCRIGPRSIGQARLLLSLARGLPRVPGPFPWPQRAFLRRSATRDAATSLGTVQVLWPPLFRQAGHDNAVRDHPGAVVVILLPGSWRPGSGGAPCWRIRWQARLRVRDPRALCSARNVREADAGVKDESGRRLLLRASPCDPPDRVQHGAARLPTPQLRSCSREPPLDNAVARDGSSTRWNTAR